MELLGMVGGAAWSVVFFVIALSIIVAIHEYGHYIVGRWSGIHAEVFSIGFGPVLLSRVDRRGTRWQIAAIPFGGYVKFMGDADATSVRGAEMPAGLTPAERRHTMAGAPLWARSATVLAGPVANFILTFAILGGLIWSTGIAEDRAMVGRLLPIPQEQPLREGDVILAIDGNPTPDMTAFARLIGGQLEAKLPHSATMPFTVLRDGQEITLQAPHPQPALLGDVQVRSAAFDAGLKTGDVILKAGGRDMITFADLQDVVFNSEGNPIPLTVWRNGQTFEQTLTPRRRDMPAEGGGFITRWMMSVGSGWYFDPVTRPAGLLETLGLAASQMWYMTTTTFSGLGHMITGQISTCNLSGVVGMAETMGDAAQQGTTSFITMLAVLSLGVGILNLLPIPVLDGGHLVFHAWEAVFRRPPPDGALRLLMTVGLTLLLSLMAFALLQDVTC